MLSSLRVKFAIFIGLSTGVTYLLLPQITENNIFRLMIILAANVLVGTFIINHCVTGPLNELTKSMGLLEEGNSNAKLQINGSREMKVLSVRFNLMVDRILQLVDITAQQVFELAQAHEREQHNSELLTINTELKKTLDAVSILNTRQESMYLGVINAMVSTIEASDPYTHGHSERVTNYSLALARRIGFADDQLKILERAAILHDIGKIGIDKTILHKPGKLTSEEYSIMQQHPEIGVQILRNIESLSDVQAIVVKHHERYDGKGYPNRISGKDLPTEALILSIADTFDAMTSHRPYRRGLPVEVAIRELSDNAGSQFDPELVQHFIATLRSGGLTTADEADPLQPDDSFKFAGAAQKADAEHAPINILVVEDDPQCASLVRDYLQKMGHMVDKASTGRDGVRMFTVKRYDLVLLDIGLPDLVGYVVANTMRKVEIVTGRDSESRAIICALTSQLEEDGGLQAFANGMNLFIEKPINTAVITDIIEMASQVAKRNSSQVALTDTDITIPGGTAL